MLKLKKWIEKNNKNVRWEVRYKNLLKKYEALEEENKRLLVKLDTDLNQEIIINKDKLLLQYKRMITNLQEDNKKYIKELHNEEKRL